MNDAQIPERLLERFLRYAAADTQSDREKADSGIFPSTESQKDFARRLSGEIRALGLDDVTLDDNFYVLARVSASPGLEDKPSFGLCAHIDTASDAPGANVRPIVRRDWNGSPITLEGGFVLDPASDSELAACTGHTLITTDGSTLLGADDKAGIAGILTFVEYLLAHPEVRHGPIELLFSPDEETGHGMDRVPLKELRSKAFYTVDGGDQGEIETECFNAWKAEITFTGIAAHLGTARGRMVNAVTMAASFVSCLPAAESPETTDGYLGYFCPLEIGGSTEQTVLTVFLRDFDRANMERRLDRLDAIARGIEARFPGGTVTIGRTCQYLNMKQKLDATPGIRDKLLEAARRAGVETRMKPIRGGTDGSRLTELGIPTPNLFTGGHNYHSRTEWASLEQMTRMVQTLIELARLWGE